MKTTADNQLQVGDRVKVIKYFKGIDLTGRKGTVRSIRRFDIGVEFDVYFSVGHNLHGKCENGKGRYGKITEVIKLPLQYDLFDNKI
jgi:hypothetical protein